MFVTHRQGEILLGGLKEDDSAQAWSFVELELNAPVLFIEVVRVISRARYKSVLMTTSIVVLKKAMIEEGPDFQIEKISVVVPSRLTGTESWEMERLDEILQVADSATNRSGVMFKTVSGKKYFSELGEWTEPLRVDKHIYKSPPKNPPSKSTSGG
ncbi:hypothetical protein [Pseudomonas sp. PDM20]|uniref:hypothetical protein n=1 Tax=Pseudomonas sp. PDM20 TaxID=2769254 RepID=UPI00177AC9DB|nr:hypothetical protein [Pseudomonas sp. PDM20]MBD9686048.1 hypothetical protein [Pseudomonas sp. PDM20]